MDTERLESFAEARKSRYLISDDAQPHLAKNRMIREITDEVDFIPGGHTPELQVEDVEIKRPLKTKLREFQEDWMQVNEKKKPAHFVTAK